MKSLFLIFISIFFWSLLPLIVSNYNNGQYATILMFSQLFASIFIGFILYYRFKLKSSFVINIKAIKRRKLKIYAIITGVLIGIHNLILYYALSHEKPITVIIIAETWPIIALLLSPFFYTNKNFKKMKMQNFIFIFSGFLGVIVINLSTDNSLKINTTIILVFIQAILNAIVTLLLPKVSLLVKSGNKLDNIFISQLICRFIAFFVIGLWVIFNYQLIQINISVILTGLIIGVFIIGIGSTLYSLAFLSTNKITITLMWWITPVLSIIWIAIFNQEKLPQLSILGALIILISNLFLQLPYKYPISTIGTILFLFLCSYYVAFGNNIVWDESNATIFGVGTLVFTLLIRYFLTKIYDNEHKDIEYFNSVFQFLRKLEIIDDNINKTTMTRELFQLLSEYEQLPSIVKRNKIDKVYNLLLNYINTNFEQLTTKGLDKKEISEFSTKYNYILSKLNFQFPIVGQVIVIIVGIFICLGLLFNKPETFIGSLAVILISSSLLYFILQLIDYSLNQKNIDLNKVADYQFSYLGNRDKCYLGEEVVLNNLYLPVNRKIEITYYSSLSKKGKSLETNPNMYYMKFLPLIISTLIILLLIIQLYSHYVNNTIEKI